MWAQAINIFIGLWIMISPYILALEGAAADNNHITGPLVITVAITALWEVNRNIRWVNIATGLWLMLSTIFFSFPGIGAIVSNIVSGLAILLFSLVKGRIEKRYGGGWRSLFQKDPVHMRG